MTVAEFIEGKIVEQLTRKAIGERFNMESDAFNSLLEIKTEDKKLFSTKSTETWIAELPVLSHRCCRGENGSFYRLSCRGRVEVGYYPHAKHGPFACVIEIAEPNSSYLGTSFKTILNRM